MKVRITQGDPTKVDVEGEQNVLPYVEIAVSSGELIIGLSRTTKFKDTKPVTITIHRSGLHSIQAKTAYIITAELPIQGDQLAITLDEASKLTAPIRVEQLTVNLEAASSVDFTGKAQRAVFQLEGASRVTAPELMMTKAELTLTGTSHAVIHKTDSLSASADGVSSLTYLGDPTVTQQHATGLSSIKHKN